MRVGTPSLTNTGGVSRVVADVEGTALWFESTDILLTPAPEAWGSALLLAAAARGEALTLNGVVDERWRAGTAEVLTLAQQWWGYRASPPQAAVGTAEVAPARKQSGDGLCFTLGVDSFFSLLHWPGDLRWLVFVHGYDVPLDDHVRMQAIRSALLEVAQARGLRPVVVRTNLREHPAFGAALWEVTHGGALAAVGHLLQSHLRRLVVSSSYPRVYQHPWGSHWQLDPLWSSRRLEIAHFGDHRWRAEKLAEIADEPLVRRHLRVCWENRRAKGNCGRCEKCLRTQLVLAQAGKLEAFTCFDDTEPLSRRVDRLFVIKPYLAPVYERFCQPPTAPETIRAIRALLLRTRLAHRPIPGRIIRLWWRLRHGL